MCCKMMEHTPQHTSVACSLVIILLIFPTSIFASDWPLAQLISQFQEELREKIPLSGGVLAGLGLPVRPRSFARRQLPSLIVSVPRSLDTLEACVTVRSRDGRYRAKNSYQFPASARGGFAEMPFPTNYEQLLSTYKADEIAVLSTSHSCEYDHEGLILPSAWGDPEHSTINTLILYANSGRKNVKCILASDFYSEATCQRLHHDHMMVFDTVCKLAIPTNEDDNITIKIIEYRLENEVISTSLHRIGL